MLSRLKMFALGACAALAAFGSIGVGAQQTDGSDYHPLKMNSPPSPEVDAGAVAAAHPSGTEAVGQSTSAPVTSSASAEAVYKDAVAASHASGTEAVGQSTAAPMVRSGMGQ